MSKFKYRIQISYMRIMPKKRFQEASKVLTLRVPTSRFDNLKVLFNSIVKKEVGTNKYDYLELLKLAIREKDSFINSINSYLKKHDVLTHHQFFLLHKNVDMSIITEVDHLLRTGVN